MRAMTMLSPAHNDKALRRPRFGLTEVLLIAGILAFGAFALINEGQQGLHTLLSGVEDVVRG
jgi:hypothetical protein